MPGKNRYSLEGHATQPVACLTTGRQARWGGPAVPKRDYLWTDKGPGKDDSQPAMLVTSASLS